MNTYTGYVTETLSRESTRPSNPRIMEKTLEFAYIQIAADRQFMRQASLRTLIRRLFRVE